MENMLQAIEKTMHDHSLVSGGQRVLAGVSGGADSVALLLALNELAPRLAFSLCAAHLNHGIRGEAADGDQAFVRELCEAMGVPLAEEKLDIPSIAKAQGKTLEQAARDERYAFLQRSKTAFRADSIAVAHHMDDQAESILLHLIRGTGLKGLCGMQYKRDDVIRPMLDLRRSDIEAFLAARGQAFRTDSTNFDRDSSRNKLRLDVIPYISENLNPGFVEGLCSMGGLLRQDEEYLDGIAAAELDRAKTERGYNRAMLAALPWAIQTRALRIAMKKAGALTDIDRVHVERVMGLLNMDTGASADLPHISAWVSYGDICFGSPKSGVRFEEKFIFPGITRFPGGYFLAEKVEGGIIKSGTVAYMDIDSLPAGMVIRPRQSGDRFHPYGAPGGKKLKDVLIDKKIPRDMRDVPILFSGSEALFVPGIGIADTVRVTERTCNLLKVSWIKE